MIEVDIETRGLQWYNPAHELFLVQFMAPEHHKALVLKHPDDREHIQTWLERDDDFRAWNSKFDFHGLEAAGYTLPSPERWHDGMVMAHLIDERRSVALQSVANSMFGEEEAGAATEAALRAWLDEETKRRRKVSKDTGIELIRPNYSDVPDSIMYPYAGHDVELTRRICEELESKMSDKLWELYRLEMKVLAALYETEKLGLNIDRGSAAAFEDELEESLDRHVCEASKLAETENFNPKSSQQVGKALKARGADLTFARKLKSGLPSTDNESLEAVSDPLARTILDFRSTEKLFGTYVHPMLHPTIDSKTKSWRAPFVCEDNKLHSNFLQVGTRTGRMSSAQPNVQNWHRDDLRMRHVVVARPGYKLVTADLDSIELKLFAAFVGEGTLLDMMRDPDSDIHTHTATMLGLKDFDRGEGHIESARQRGKKYNYLTVYGGGVRAIRRWFRVDQKVAKGYERAFHNAYPEVGAFQEDIEIRLENRGYVETPWGRRHRPYDVRNVEREAYKFTNYLVQGTAGDLIKASLVAVHEAGIPVITIVHDEIMAEVPESMSDETATILVQCMTDHPKVTEVVPLTADSAIVDRWSFAKNPEFEAPYAQ